jgi:F-type H+-transporting ATPase subunit b
MARSPAVVQQRRKPGRRPARTLIAAAGLLAVLSCATATTLGAGVLDLAEAAGSAAEGGTESHGESLGALLSRLANFAILAGGLWYLLRSPFGRYAAARAESIREGLVNAAQTKSRAIAQRAEIDARLKALPGELDALRVRGAEEIAAEEARIRQAAERDRHRQLDHMRRDVDAQVQAARRSLTIQTANLAIESARRRIGARISDADQARLIDRYVVQLGARHE